MKILYIAGVAPRVVDFLGTIVAPGATVKHRCPDEESYKVAKASLEGMDHSLELVKETDEDVTDVEDKTEKKTETKSTKATGWVAPKK